MYSQLNINGYHSAFILGNNPEEKLKKCEVIINISLRFIGQNSSCETDNLENTICYAKLLKFIDKKLLNAQFNLIERATSFVFKCLGEYLDQYCDLKTKGFKKVLKKLELIKVEPAIHGFASNQNSLIPTEFQTYLESASFVISDWD